MSTADDQADIARMTLTLQIIAAVMIAGLAGFLAMVAFVRAQQKAMPPGPPRAPTSPVLSYLAVGFGAAGLAASVLVPGSVVSAARRQIARGTWEPPRQAGRSDAEPPTAKPLSDAMKLAHVYQAQWISGAAINEGPAFFALIAYMLDGRQVTLGLALLLGVGMALRYPTRPRIESWIDQQLQLIAQDRQFSG